MKILRKPGSLRFFVSLSVSTLLLISDSIIRIQAQQQQQQLLQMNYNGIATTRKLWHNRHPRNGTIMKHVLLTVLSFVNPPPPPANQAAVQYYQMQQQNQHHPYPYNNNPQGVYFPPNYQQYNQYYGYQNNVIKQSGWMRNGVTGCVIGILLRGMKIVGTAFLLSELLAQWGVFGSNEASNTFDLNRSVQHVKRKIEDFKCLVQKKWYNFQQRYLTERVLRNSFGSVANTISNFPTEVLAPAMKSYRVLPNKTKFATGTSLGMFWSRIMLRISWKMTKVCGFVYIGHELLQYFNIIGNDEAYLNQIWVANIQADQKQSILQGVEFIRRHIVEFIDQRSYEVQVFIGALIEEETATAVGMVVGTLLGFII